MILSRLVQFLLMYDQWFRIYLLGNILNFHEKSMDLTVFKGIRQPYFITTDTLMQFYSRYRNSE